MNPVGIWFASAICLYIARAADKYSLVENGILIFIK